MDWAQDVGCANDCTLIANCLEFMDNEAQVTILSYLRSLFHCLAAKSNEPKKDGHPSPGLKKTTNDKQSTEDKGKDTSGHTTQVSNWFTSVFVFSWVSLV